MSLKTEGIINKAAYPKKEKYNILTFDTHERYQTQLSKTGHNFFSFRYENCKRWDTNYASIPENYYILPEGSLPTSINFDFILSQSKFGQFQVSKQLQGHLSIPVLSLEHTLPLPHWTADSLEQFRSMVGDLNVFISEYSVGEWNMSCEAGVIHHSVDTDLFSPTKSQNPKIVDKILKPHVLSVVNEFKNRDYCCNYGGWQRITKDLDTFLVGSCSEGLSKPASSIEDLVDSYNHASVFLNTSTVSPVPTSLLEAMSCGCPVVSTATCMIPEIIENGVNGFISNDEQELKDYCVQLMEDKDLAKQIGAKGRETILDKFSEEKFINNWNNTFDKAYGVKK